MTNCQADRNQPKRRFVGVIIDQNESKEPSLRVLVSLIDRKKLHMI